jgi:cytochrome b561
MNSLNKTDQPEKYSLGIILFHWLSLVIILATFVLGFVHAHWEDIEWADDLIDWHRFCGMTFMLIVLLRISLRVRGFIVASNPKPSPSGMLQRAASATHLLIYVLMLILPILGWAMTSAQGGSVTLGWGWGLALPALTEINPDMADVLQEWHQMAAYTLVGLVGMHACAALFHHYVLNDDVLTSMFPKQSHFEQR